MSQQNRAANLVTTATTVVALLALASVVRGAPAMHAMESGRLETNAALRESAVIRAVVVAVAAARDLFSTDQAVSAVNIVSNYIHIVPDRCAALSNGCNNRNRTLHDPLDERLLDLPPPLI